MTKLNLKLWLSKTAGKLCPGLDGFDYIVVNYLAQCQIKKKSVSSAVLQDLIRTRGRTYLDIINKLESARIIIRYTGFVHDKENPENNRCRFYFLNYAVLREISAKTAYLTQAKQIDFDKALDVPDNSIINDELTLAILNNLKTLTLNKKKLNNAFIEVDSLVVLRKLVSGIFCVKQSHNTNRISHILLHAGSKAIREFMEINGKKPVDFDMSSAHWQFLLKKVSGTDSLILEEWLNNGFYEAIMTGTGLRNRNLVKKLCQQVITNKEIGNTAKRIQKYIFAELPSLKTYCESVWAKGKTMQGTLQTIESSVINAICRKLNDYGKWFVPFFDGVWIEKESVSLLKTLMGDYLFEQKK